MVRYQPITARRSQKSQGKQKLSEQVPAIRGQHRSPKKLPRPQSHAGTKLNLWQKGNMAGAMEEYRKQEEKPSTERLSIRLIARAWNVPYETLRRRLSGKLSKVESASGRPTILSQQSEEELAETVRKMARAGFPLSRKDIREIAYAYSDAKGIKGFSESKKITGYYWFQGFLNRFPDISTKKTENLSAARAMGMNKTQVMKWFDLYEGLVQRLDIKDSPRHIWNVDETDVMNIHKAEEAVAIVGEPAYNLTALERGETSTVLAALNAFGDIIPPMIIHKGKTVGKGWKDGAPLGAIVKASDSCWINKDLFVEFGQLFVNNLQRLGLLNGRPHLLIMDNHYSHVFNLEFLNLMKANNIHVFALPSHTTHWLQPLDRVPFGSFKRKCTLKNKGRNF
ncbi:uncharacterized protein LOC136085358 [Hydra vulgaris]|uniref:Uncharacterized protein LOC136085358 n=1 Tax=Hydra vulgaris TaxID=6087 RepID=A0ABM4CLR5_HYDVU